MSLRAVTSFYCYQNRLVVTEHFCCNWQVLFDQQISCGQQSDLSEISICCSLDRVDGPFRGHLLPDLLVSQRAKRLERVRSNRL